MPVSLVVLPVGEPVLLCFQVHGSKVKGTIVRDKSLETLVVMTSKVVDGKTAE
jgi:hypothetical protein